MRRSTCNIGEPSNSLTGSDLKQKNCIDSWTNVPAVMCKLYILYMYITLYTQLTISRMCFNALFKSQEKACRLTFDRYSSRALINPLIILPVGKTVGEVVLDGVLARHLHVHRVPVCEVLMQFPEGRTPCTISPSLL